MNNRRINKLSPCQGISVSKTMRVFLVALLFMVNQTLFATPAIHKLPSLDDIDHIYVLGTFDIPDLPKDQDGIRDRPRYIIWPDHKIPKQADGIDLGALQKRFLQMLGTRYQTVTHQRWHNNYHRIGDYNKGGIVYKDGTLVGWFLDLGGLGYLDFAYNPIYEKATFLLPKLKTKPKASPAETRIYRVPDWSKIKQAQ